MPIYVLTLYQKADCSVAILEIFTLRKTRKKKTIYYDNILQIVIQLHLIMFKHFVD